MNNVVLEVKNVTKIFGNKIATNNISFNIMEGEVFGLLGPSGSGKTVLMRMICGLTHITRGNIFICNWSVKYEHEKAIKHVGGFIGEPKLYQNLSGFNNLKYYASFYNNITRDDILKYARILGIEHIINKKVYKYNDAQKQRLCIAQALIHSPKLLVFDEPFIGLDAVGIKEMMNLLKILSKSEHISILISSKTMNEMEQLCDTIGIMNNGRIIELKSLEELKETKDGSKKIKITVDYPNFAGKIVINEFRFKVDIAGNAIIIHSSPEKLENIVSRLKFYNINIFKIEFITKSLQQIFSEIIEKKKYNKNLLV